MLGLIANLISSCLQMLIGFPLGCGCTCVMFVLVAVLLVAVGVVVFNDACSANPTGLCRLLGY
ncbi:MAG: hypothetical protein M5R40_20060 [Anaerolineae bacterium]|nr:hypothetical protein [Anaerolineae bacterium]